MQQHYFAIAPHYDLIPGPISVTHTFCSHRKLAHYPNDSSQYTVSAHVVVWLQIDLVMYFKIVSINCLCGETIVSVMPGSGQGGMKGRGKESYSPGSQHRVMGYEPVQAL